METSKSFILRPIVLAIAIALCHPAAQAVKLGEPIVLSHVGEPLKLTIPIIEATQAELDDLSVSIANSDSYTEAQLIPPSWLKSAAVAIDNKDGMVTITADVQQDSIADIIINLRSSSGQRNQMISVLLDPSDSKDFGSALVSGAKPGKKGSRIQKESSLSTVDVVKDKKNIVGDKEKSNKPRRGKSLKERLAEKSIKTKSGDTLSSIVKSKKNKGISLEQLLVAYTKENPNAFINGNMNRMRSGVILNAPTDEAVKAIGRKEAKDIVIAQSRNFGRYSNHLADQVKDVAAIESPSAKQSASGKIQARVEDKSQHAQVTDRLTLSSAPEKKDSVSQGNAVGPAARFETEEDKIVAEKEVELAKARLAELESNIEALKKLDTLQNVALAEAMVNAEKKNASKQLDEPKNEVKGDEPTKEVREDEPTKEVKDDEPKTEVKKDTPKKDEPAEPSLLDEFSYSLIGGGVTITALVLWLWSKRRKSESESLFDEDETDEDEDDAESESDETESRWDPLPNIPDDDGAEEQVEINAQRNNDKTVVAQHEPATSKKEPSFDAVLASIELPKPEGAGLLGENLDFEVLSQGLPVASVSPIAEVPTPKVASIAEDNKVNTEPNRTIESTPAPHQDFPDLDFLDAAGNHTHNVEVQPLITSSASAGSDGGNKLELAKLFIEMGDTNGALELLNEIVEGTDLIKRAEALALISKISLNR